MELVEIRNNLVKMSYTEEENPILGHFITITSQNKSYVAQFVNIKVDSSESFAIARLLFIFSNEGIVDTYDGSAPSLSSTITPLPSSELLSILPIKTPIKFGVLSQQGEPLNVDASVFEQNLVIFSERDYEAATLISNCVRQLFRLKKKSVVIDSNGAFSSFPNLVLRQDFKLPLNEDLIDFIFKNEISGVDDETKVFIQNIFYDVSQYIKTLEHKFLPIEQFIDVVTKQYKETQIPELALLKNKLLKYRDADIFANDYSEIEALISHLKQKNTTIINLKDVGENLQKYIIPYIHTILNDLESETYLFAFLNDDNSNKKMLKRMINNSHVLSIIIAKHSYKYAQDMKEYAQNMIFFAPNSMQHDFATYNTFLSKLGQGECIMYGQLTHNIPFIIDIEDMELDLTQEDVFGEKRNDSHVRLADTFINEAFEEKEQPSDYTNYTQENVLPDIISNTQVDDYTYSMDNNSETSETQNQNEIIDENYYNTEEIENILSDDNYEEPQTNDISETPQDNDFTELSEEELDFMDVPQTSDEDNPEENLEDYTIEDDTENEQQMIPVYPIEEDEYEEVSDEDIGFEKGDVVNHPRYGQGTVEKIIKYGNKTLCSINFENVGKRLLDPSISEFEKL